MKPHHIWRFVCVIVLFALLTQVSPIWHSWVTADPLPAPERQESQNPSVLANSKVIQGKPSDGVASTESQAQLTSQWANMSIEPDTVHAEVGDTFTVDVWVRNAVDMTMVWFVIGYETGALRLVWPPDRYQWPFQNPTINSLSLESFYQWGTVRLHTTAGPTDPPVTGDGRLVSLTFEVLRQGETIITFREASIQDSSGRDILGWGYPCQVHVGAVSPTPTETATSTATLMPGETPTDTPPATPEPTLTATPTTTPASSPVVNMESYPPLIAPHSRLPLTWEIRGGTNVAATHLLWDTSSHEYRNDYQFQTPSQTGGMGFYSAIIDVPTDAQAIYLKPYAVVDGTEVYGGQEYVVPTSLAINVGGSLWGIDSTGQYWNPDRPSDFGSTWYEIVGGEFAGAVRPISNTDDAWIYRTQRQGTGQFTIWLSTGVYQMTVDVEFRLAELEATGPGQRVFDIYLERGTPNEVALHDVDVYDLAGGQDTATTLTTTVTVLIIPGVDEHLNIEFEGDGDIPILNGLVLRGLHAVPQYHITQKVGAGADDTYTDDHGTHLTDIKVLLGGGSQAHGGFRFPALHMPQSAVIRYASLEVTRSNTGNLTQVDIYGHAHDSSPSFQWQAVVPNRPRTAHCVPWNLSAPDGTYHGSRYVSPDIAPVVQEVVDRPGWNDANALSLLLIAAPVEQSVPCRVWSYEGSYNDRALLSIYYSRLEDVPTPTPTLAGRVALPLIVR